MWHFSRPFSIFTLSLLSILCQGLKPASLHLFTAFALFSSSLIQCPLPMLLTHSLLSQNSRASCSVWAHCNHGILTPALARTEQQSNRHHPYNAHIPQLCPCNVNVVLPGRTLYELLLPQLYKWSIHNILSVFILLPNYVIANHSAEHRRYPKMEQNVSCGSKTSVSFTG